MNRASVSPLRQESHQLLTFQVGQVQLCQWRRAVPT